MQSEPVAQEQNTDGTWVDIPPDPPSAPLPEKPAVPAEEADDEPETPAAADPKPAAVEKPAEKKPRNDPQARIDQMRAKQTEAERRAHEAERRAEDAERRARDLAAATRQQPPAAAAPPQADKFPDYATYLQSHPEASLEQWLDDRDTWRDERRDAQIRERTEAERLDTTFKTKASTFGERFAQAAKADPDLKDRINERLLGVKPYSTLTAEDKAIIRAIPDPMERERVAFECFLADQWIDSEHAVALLEHLSDPKEFQRLVTLPPNQVIRELTKLETRLSAAPDRGPAPDAKPVTSKAPPPVQPLRSSPHVSDDEPGDDADDDTWARWEIARMKRQRTR